jgi:hypothetical protein
VNATRHLLRSLLVLALFVAGEIAASAHFAFVQHRVCAEHAKLEHAPMSRAVPACVAHEAPDAAEHSRGPALVADGADSADHEHCPLGDKLAPRTLPPSCWTGAALDAASPALLAPRTDPIARAFPLHLLAPKHSPPAAS